MPELPATGSLDVPVFYFPRPTKTRPEHDGVWLKIRSESGKFWVGVFAFGYVDPPAISRVVGTPDPTRVCVVSRGAAYIANTEDPDVWEQIPITPVLDVRSIPERQLLLFADFRCLSMFVNHFLTNPASTFT